MPRLRLVAPVHGWVSQRLNREPPDDLEVVELVGLSTGPERDEPPRPPPRTARPALAAPPAAVGDNGAHILAGGKVGDAINAETLCVVCLSSARNATFVHGETGHIACCLGCARALRARGDSCPVCRMPIDLVIQHFWA